MVTNLAPKGLSANRVTTTLLTDLHIPTDARDRQSAVTAAVSLGQKQVAPAFCESVLTPEEAGQKLWSGTTQKATGTATSSTAVNDHIESNYGGYAVTEAQYGKPIESVAGSWRVGTSASRRT